MSSTFKKAGPRREHKERSQLASRKHLGLLEKKKDYKLWAADFAKKKKAIGILRAKTLNKNPDEFYFGMLNHKLVDGKHRKTTGKTHSADELKLMKTQDLAHVHYVSSVNAKKLEALKQSQHIVAKPKTGQHTLFVSDEEDVEHVDVAERLNTVPSLLKRTFNRPTKKMLTEGAVPEVDEVAQTIMEMEKEDHLKVWASRQQRQQGLEVMRRRTEIEKALMNKGARVKVGEDKDGVPIYKWKAIRKK